MHLSLFSCNNVTKMSGDEGILNFKRTNYRVVKVKGHNYLKVRWHQGLVHDPDWHCMKK